MSRGRSRGLHTMLTETIISGIYKIQSKIKSERIYIGSAKDISQRWRKHLNDLKNQKHHSYKLQRHYNKYGIVDLEFSVLLGCEIADLNKTEQYFIDSYKPYFNICPFAGSSRCREISEETREKLSISAKNRVVSEETRRKIGDIHRGVKKSPEFCEKMRQINLGNKNALGHKASAEARAKLKAARAGRIFSKEAREKMSQKGKGRKQTKEQIQKRIESTKITKLKTKLCQN